MISGTFEPVIFSIMTGIVSPFPENFTFNTEIPVRITDINYGNHAGNDSILSIIHEARVQYLNSFGYSELDIGGAGLIMKDMAVEFKKEIIYGDKIIAYVTAARFTKVSFDLYYRLEKISGSNQTIAVIAKTGMICYNYKDKKIAPLPAQAIEKLSGNKG